LSKNLFGDIEDAFEANCRLVLDLAGFDRIILDFADKALEHAGGGKGSSGSFMPNTIENARKAIQDVRDHGSLTTRYAPMYNQCVVLLVSHFASALHDIFKESVSAMLPDRLSKGLRSEELRLTVEDLSLMKGDNWELVAQALIRKRDLSFQDMQSVKRAFETYCDYIPEKTEDVNNIIVGQACRHVIVHAGGLVDQKCINQVRSAVPRGLKVRLRNGVQVQFTDDELATLAESMKAYVRDLVTGLREQLASRTLPPPSTPDNTTDDNDDLVGW